MPEKLHSEEGNKAGERAGKNVLWGAADDSELV